MALRRKRSPDQLKLYFEEIRDAATHAGKLTGQLLAFGRKQLLNMTVLDINQLLPDTESMLRRAIESNIELRFDLAPDLGNVEADATQLQQILLNLAVNARDAMPEGGTIEIKTEQMTIGGDLKQKHLTFDDGDYIVLSVTDTGSGMDEETINHIFEPFFSTKRSKGLGLGLATVHGIVHQHGGHILVHSEPDRGTRFEVYLPRSYGELSAVSSSPPEPPYERAGETILVVEDEARVRSLTKGMLESEGYKILEACDAQEALALADQYKDKIHLLLTDVTMPNINGKEIYLSLSQSQADLKVLYMSGYTDDIISHQGILEAGTRFIQKPFTTKALLQKLRAALEE
jgi:CheY-like chemotaxis protein